MYKRAGLGAATGRREGNTSRQDAKTAKFAKSAPGEVVSCVLRISPGTLLFLPDGLS